MTHLVVDASVAIKWVVQEPGSEQALALRRFRLMAPDLLAAECANVLWKRVRRGEMDEAAAAAASALLELADVELVPMQSMLAQATRLAAALEHPAYDCFYLVLAHNTGRQFVTADERLLRKLGTSKTSFSVTSLQAFPGLH